MRVYRYGLLPPTTGASEARRQMRLAYDYRNGLTAIECGRRAAQRALLSGRPSIATLEIAVKSADDNVSTLVRVIKAVNADARGKVDTPEQRQAVKAAKQRRKDAFVALRDERKRQREDVGLTVERERINAAAQSLAKNCRDHAGLYWGTYELVDKAHEDSTESLPLYDGLEPNNPRFRRWTGEGAIGARIVGGLPVADVMSGLDTIIRVAAVDERAWHSEMRGERRRLSRTVLSLRVGSTDKGRPVWAEFPMIMHRPLPDGGRVQRADVYLRRCGGREEWTVSLAVDDRDTLPTQACGIGAVGVDLGWRLLDGGALRVGAWRGEDGQHGEMLLDGPTSPMRSTRRPPTWRGGMVKAEELRSLRDKAFDAALAALVAWVTHERRTGAPAWFQRETVALHQWGSATRLAALAQFWRAHRFDGDAEVFDALEAWRYHDDHLWRWESNQRQKSLRERKERYRVLAARLARRYRTLVVEVFDVSEMARRPEPDAPPAIGVAAGQAPRTQRQLVSPSEFRLALINAFEARGGAVVVVDARETTRECDACGHVNRWDQAAEIIHACSACGVVWDQDENAARNILARGLADLATDPSKGVSRRERDAAKPRGGIWAQRRLAKQQRLTEKAAE